MQDKLLFFIDYDNTIFSHFSMRIPDSAMRMLREIRQKDLGHVILSTGRPAGPAEAAMLFRDGYIPDGTIGANGAYITVNDQVLRKAYMEPGLKKALMDYCLAKRYCLLCSLNGTRYVSEPEYLLQVTRYSRNDVLSWIGREGFCELYDKDIFSFYIQAPEPAMLDVERHFPEIEILRMGFQSGGGDIVLKGSSKADGMRLIAAYLGYSMSDTVAIGDSMNDYQMIVRAGTGIAMGNAMPKVREDADYVTFDIEEDGLARAVSYAFSKKGITL